MSVSGDGIETDARLDTAGIAERTADMTIDVPAVSRKERELQVQGNGGRDESALHRTGSELMIRRMNEPVPISAERRSRLKLIGNNAANGRVVEAFRTLRTLLLQQAQQANFSVLVTAVTPRSGTSFVARNLAASLALDSTRTALLIDCNRLSPSVDGLLSGNSGPGLTDLLHDPTEYSIGDVIHGTGIPRLRAIPVGRQRSNPEEYFTGSRMNAFMQIVAKRYRDRYLIIDAPPIMSSADARILSEYCHYVVVVVPYGGVDDSSLLEAIATIPQEKFAGVVFNDLPAGDSEQADNGLNATLSGAAF